MGRAQGYAGRIRVERATNNGGQNVTRNRLTDLSNGEWLVYLDADDELMPDSVEKKMAVSAGADAVYGSMEEAWFEGSSRTFTSTRTARDFDDQVAAAFWWHYPNTSGFIFRKDAIEKAGGWNVEVQNCTDYELLFRLLLQGRRFKGAEDSWNLYRHWSTSQAIYEKPERLLLTRLEIMWRTITELDRTNAVLPDRKEFFEQATFGVIRSLHKVDRHRALIEHERLLEWNSKFIPLPPRVSFRYRLAYRFGGFEFAERFASLTRPFNPRTEPGPVLHNSRKIQFLQDNNASQ